MISDKRRQHGQSLVEFALIFPVFLLAIMAVVDLGRAVYGYNTISNAARAGARVAAVNQVAADIIDRTNAQLVGLPGAATAVAGPACPAGTVGVKIGCTMSVTVTYQYQALTPIIGRIVGAVSISTKSDIPIERVSP